MAETSLEESAFWHETIHQVEDGDPVKGGAPDRATRIGGPNIAAKALADRTLWLRAELEELDGRLTAEELLRLLLTVDGTGSGLDADRLDGKHGSEFILASREGAGKGLDADKLDGLHATEFIRSSREGPGKGLDADKLDGRHGSEFILASREGSGKGLDADKLDGRHASEFILDAREGSGNGLDADKLDGRHAWDVGAAVGDIKAILAAEPPQGWLRCNGALLSKSDYPELWARCQAGLGAGTNSGNFRLPDLRGEFLRGWDAGRGVDSGRALGSSQGHMYEAHKHSIRLSHADNVDSDPAGYPMLAENGPLVTHNENQPGGMSYPDGSGTPIYESGGSETRPRNVAVHFVIKF